MSAPRACGEKKNRIRHELLIFDIDDTLHMPSPPSEPERPSSTDAQPSTSHPDWDICMARLGPAPSRSPTPDVDVVHPPPPRGNTILENKPGFFLSNNTYISHWECCQCHKIHPITDKNKRWRSKRAAVLARPQEANMMHAEKCTTLDCIGVRCDTCFDLDLVGYRRRYCSGAPCELKKTPRWLKWAVDVSNMLLPYDDGAKPEDLGDGEAQGEEEFPATAKEPFPMRPW